MSLGPHTNGTVTDNLGQILHEDPVVDYTAGPRPSQIVAPGNVLSTPNYAALHALWLLDNKASTIERLLDGFQYRAIFPSGGLLPTFVLVCSSPRTAADMAGPPAGYAGAMSLFQSSWPRGHRTLPKE